jgi:hypothetical protein
MVPVEGEEREWFGGSFTAGWAAYMSNNFNIKKSNDW